MEKRATAVKLRTRLVGAFVLVALPCAGISVGAVGLLDRLIKNQITGRTEQVLKETRNLLVDEQHEISQLVETAAGTGGLLDDLSRRPDAPDLVDQIEPWASQKAPGLGLDLLALVARPDSLEASAGELITSAHLRMAIGDPPPDIAKGLRSGETRAGFVLEMVEGNPPMRVPALIAVHAPRQAQGRVWIYGGRRLDRRLLGRVARMANARIALRVPGRTTDVYPPTAELNDGAIPFSIPLDPLGDQPGAVLDVAVDMGDFWDARRRFLWLSQFFVLGAFGAALAAGAWLSARITKPIVALSEAAERVGSGDLTVRVPTSARDEVGSLVRVFNRMTQELAEAQGRIQRAERAAAWREVARRLAHEIKNPLSPMRLGMENLRKAWDKQHPALGEILDESTRSVLDEVGSLDRLVSAFSAFARLPAPEPSPVDPVELLENASRLYDDRVVGDFTSLRAQGLPMVMADAQQVGRALVNLVKNAKEALESADWVGGVRLDAWAESYEERAGVILEVADDGPGMPEAVRVRAASVYYTTKATGTGLGLAIVQRTMEEHGGHLSILSHPGSGTRVRLWLPIAE